MACNLSLTHLVLTALDDFNRINELQQLLDVALDGNPDKMHLLIDVYQTMSAPYLEDLDRTLNQLQKMLTGNEPVE